MTAILPMTTERKKRAGLCSTPRCSNECREGRTKCNTCRNRLYDTPLRRKFRNIKARVKRQDKERRKGLRNIRFALTYEEFEAFALENGFDAAIHDGDNWTVDRIDPWNDDKGYCVGNLQVLTRGDNSRKAWADRQRALGVWA